LFTPPLIVFKSFKSGIDLLNNFLKMIFKKGKIDMRIKEDSFVVRKNP